MEDGLFDGIFGAIKSTEEDEIEILEVLQDLSQPIQHLKTLIEQKVGSLLDNNWTFWLQDSQIVRIQLPGFPFSKNCFFLVSVRAS